MYVLLLITGIAIGTVTVEPLNTFDDLQACEKAAARTDRHCEGAAKSDHTFSLPAG